MWTQAGSGDIGALFGWWLCHFVQNWTYQRIVVKFKTLVNGGKSIIEHIWSYVWKQHAIFLRNIIAYTNPKIMGDDNVLYDDANIRKTIYVQAST